LIQEFGITWSVNAKQNLVSILNEVDAAECNYDWE
jgi:hypothetical protein